VEAIDGALTGFGFPVGPMTLLDEVGIDVGAKVAKVLHGAFGDRMSVPEAMAKVLESGRLGRKNGKGFYAYGDPKRKKAVDGTVYDVLPGGRARKKVDPAEIVERCVLQMVNESILTLDEGILRSARDGDVGAVFGLGFPPFRGGPFRWADAEGTNRVLERMRRLEGRFGARFRPAPLLVERGAAGRTFHA
jgi:3-hydroxyacyl-CoA dehydrogenase/enoyl-CoA hydratase/3-hydroxybutyryl-CoA epimerase